MDFGFQVEDPYRDTDNHAAATAEEVGEDPGIVNAEAPGTSHIDPGMVNADAPSTSHIEAETDEEIAATTSAISAALPGEDGGDMWPRMMSFTPTETQIFSAQMWWARLQQRQMRFWSHQLAMKAQGKKL
jgi:hypothetical protein